MSQLPNLNDLKVFITTVQAGGFSAAALVLNSSAAYVSKRIGVLEDSLNVKLFYRGARGVSLTMQGKLALTWAERLLDTSDDMIHALEKDQISPEGVVRIVTSTGFGSCLIAPLLSKLSALYPKLEVDLELLDRPVDLISEGFDMEIRTNYDIPDDLIIRKIFSNNRILCASPSYIEQFGIPQTLMDLKRHQCILIREREATAGKWILHKGSQKLKTNLNYSMKTNSGEVARQWCLDGHGIILRSAWSVQHDLATRNLIQIMPEYYYPADFYMLYPRRLDTSAKLRIVANYLSDHLDQSKVL